MKILVLVTDAFGGHGGISEYNKGLLSALCSFNDTVEVVAVPRVVPQETGLLPKNLTYITKASNSKMKYFLELTKIKYQAGSYDLIICGHINLLPLAYLMQLGMRVPLYLVIYGMEVWEKRRRWLANYLTRKIDKYITISKVTGNRFVGWSKIDPAKGVVIPNAVDLGRFTPGPRGERLVDRYDLKGKIALMTLARLEASERNKGIDQVLEVLPGLRAEFSNLVYLIVGDGTDRGRLQEKAKSLGIADIVIFAGYVTEEDKIDHYRLADVFVMPGRQEGFGFVYLEAMACGVPVIGSKIDGSREALREGKLGFLVNPDDPNEIRESIIAAMRCPKGVVPNGIEYFSTSRFEERVHQVLRSLH